MCVSVWWTVSGDQHIAGCSWPQIVTVKMTMQDVMDLRAQMAVSGAAALQRQGFLDAAQEILQQYRGSAGAEAAAATAEAELRIVLAQACCYVSSRLEAVIYLSMHLGLHGGRM